MHKGWSDWAVRWSPGECRPDEPGAWRKRQPGVRARGHAILERIGIRSNQRAHDCVTSKLALKLLEAIEAFAIRRQTAMVLEKANARCSFWSETTESR